MTESGRVVVAGAGLAGFRTVDELRARGFAGPVTLVGAEPRPPYDRPPLSKKFLAEPGLDPSLKADFAALEGDFRPDEAATGLGDELITSRGAYPFDHLVLATGAHPVTLPGDRLAGGLRGAAGERRGRRRRPAHLPARGLRGGGLRRVRVAPVRPPDAGRALGRGPAPARGDRGQRARRGRGLRPGAVLLVRAVRPDGAVRRPPRRRRQAAVARRPGRTHLVGVLAGGWPPGRDLDRRPPPRHAPGPSPHRIRRPGRSLPSHRSRH